MQTAVLEKLDQLIAVSREAAIPLESRWLDAEGVAAMLSFKPRYVLEKLACRTDFPKPLRIDGSGHPRWRATDIQRWAERHAR